MECPKCISSGAKGRPAALCLGHIGSHRCLAGNQGIGRGATVLSPAPLKFLQSCDFPKGSQGLLQSPFYEKLADCLLPADQGVSCVSAPWVTCLLPLPPCRSPPTCHQVPGPCPCCPRQVCPFSLLIFSVTKNYPMMSKGLHSPQPTSPFLVPARMGWAQQNPGWTFTAHIHAQLSDTGQEGVLLPPLASPWRLQRTPLSWESWYW